MNVLQINEEKNTRISKISLHLNFNSEKALIFLFFLIIEDLKIRGIYTSG